MSPSPFHIGEQQVQTRAGVREAIESRAQRVVRGFLPDQHRAFYARLPFVVAAARDAANRPWVTLLVGPPGFAQSPDPRSLRLATRPLAGDALETALTVGAELGVLGIELETRRRNRANGTIGEAGAAGLRLDVEQTFGNCPRYITARTWRWVDAEPARAAVSRHDRLDEGMQAWIGSTDTLFISSGYRGDGDRQESSGMDASHRGGAPGFVEVRGERRLVFPDYAGNHHFNTLGNLVMDARVGLLFVDFARGSLLQITGTATIDWDSGELARHAGAERLVVIDIDAIVRLEHALPLRWRCACAAAPPTASAGSVENTRRPPAAE